jgi:hypothetical protein
MIVTSDIYKLRRILRKIEKDLQDPTPRIGSIHPTYKIKLFGQKFEMWGSGKTHVIFRLIGFEAESICLSETSPELFLDNMQQMFNDLIVNDVMIT